MLHYRDIRYTNSQAAGRAQRQSEAEPQVGMAAGRQAGRQVGGRVGEWVGRLSAGADLEPEPPAEATDVR